MTRRRLLVSVAVVLLATLVVTATALWLALPSLARWALVRQVAAQAGRTLTMREFTLDLRGGHLRITGLRLDDREPGPPLAELDRLEVRFRPSALLRGHLWIDDLALDNPRVRIVRTARGVLNISDLLRAVRAPEEDSRRHPRSLGVDRWRDRVRGPHADSAPHLAGRGAGRRGGSALHREPGAARPRPAHHEGGGRAAVGRDVRGAPRPDARARAGQPEQHGRDPRQPVPAGRHRGRARARPRLGRAHRHRGRAGWASARRPGPARQRDGAPPRRGHLAGDRAVADLRADHRERRGRAAARPRRGRRPCHRARSAARPDQSLRAGPHQAGDGRPGRFGAGARPGRAHRDAAGRRRARRAGHRALHPARLDPARADQPRGPGLLGALSRPAASVQRHDRDRPHGGRHRPGRRGGRRRHDARPRARHPQRRHRLRSAGHRRTDARHRLRRRRAGGPDARGPTPAPRRRADGADRARRAVAQGAHRAPPPGPAAGDHRAGPHGALPDRGRGASAPAQAGGRAVGRPRRQAAGSDHRRARARDRRGRGRAGPGPLRRCHGRADRAPADRADRAHRERRHLAGGPARPGQAHRRHARGRHGRCRGHRRARPRPLRAPRARHRRRARAVPRLRAPERAPAGPARGGPDAQGPARRADAAQRPRHHRARRRLLLRR